MFDRCLLPEKNRIASFDVDAQNTFTPHCPEELPVPGGGEIVAELNRQAQFAAFRVGSKDAHSPKADWLTDAEHPIFTPLKAENMDQYWPAHAIVGSKGFELISGLPPVHHYDYFVWKGVEPDMHPYGACFHDLAEKMSTGVIEFLGANGVTTVLVGGLATDYCVKTTVLQLCRANFRVIVNLSACRAIAADTETSALKAMVAAGASIIHSCQQLDFPMQRVDS